MRKRSHWPWSSRPLLQPATPVLKESPVTSYHLPEPTPVAPEQRPSLLKPLPFYRTAELAVDAERWPTEAIWYTSLLFVCAAVALMLWGGYSALPRSANSENLLRAEQSVPKLKGEMRAESPAVETLLLPPPPPLEPVAFEAPALPVAALPPVPPPPPAPAPMPLAVPRVELSPIAPVQALDPIIPLHQDPLVYVSRDLGDTPMLRTWKTLTLFSLLALAPTVAIAGEDPKVQKRLDELEPVIKEISTTLKTISSSIEGMKSNLDKLQKDTTTLREASLLMRTDIDGVTTRVDNLDKLMQNLQSEVKLLRQRVNEPSAAPADRAGMDELRKQLTSIEQAILKLRGADSGTGRISLSPPASTGKVVLANMYHEDMLFVINQKAHRVSPGQVLPLDNVPAGTLRYEVISPTWGLRASNSAALPANETFTLTAR